VTTKLAELEKGEADAVRRLEEARREAQRITAGISERIRALEQELRQSMTQEQQDGEAVIRKEVEALRVSLAADTRAAIDGLKGRRSELTEAATRRMRSAIADGKD